MALEPPASVDPGIPSERTTSPESSPGSPGPEGPPATVPTAAARAIALLEVLICSDYPTQLALSATFNAAGFAPLNAKRELALGYVVTLSLVDTIVLVALILLFLRAHGERIRDVFIGRRPVAEEFRHGLVLIFAALAIGISVLVATQLLAPSLHNVARNPLQDLIRTPRDAALFAVVVVVAGGVREEIQRAFVLQRFERWLGGGTLGVIVGSVAFGAGHLLQGADAAIATGLLGVFWGIVYLRRRSVVAPMVSHSGFNLFEIAQYLVAGG